MKINRPLIQKIIFVCLIVGSTLTLFANKGLYHFELNSNIEARLSGTPEDKKALMDKVDNPNLVRADKINYELYYENTDRQSVKDSLDKINEGTKVTYTITNNFYTRDDVLKNDIWLVGFLIVSSLLIFLYFLLRSKNLTFKETGKLILEYFLIVLFSNLFLAATISLLSRFYQIKEFDLAVFLIMNIWLSFIFFLSIWRLGDENRNNFFDRKYVLIFLLILAIVNIGLGMNFIIDTLVFLLSIVFVDFNFEMTREFLNLTNDFKLPKPNLKTLVPSRSKQTVVETQPVNNPTTSKKKKKKSKKKHK